MDREEATFSAAIMLLIGTMVLLGAGVILSAIYTAAGWVGIQILAAIIGVYAVAFHFLRQYLTNNHKR